LFKSVFHQNLNFSGLYFYHYEFSSSHFILLSVIFPFLCQQMHKEKKRVISRDFPHLSFFLKKRLRKKEELKWK